MNFLRGVVPIAVFAAAAVAVFVLNDQDPEVLTAVQQPAATSDREETFACCELHDKERSMAAEAGSVAAQLANKADEVLQPVNSQVDALFHSFEAEENKSVDSSVFYTLRDNAVLGRRVSLSLPGFDVEGEVQAYEQESTVQNFAIDLDGGLGRAYFTVHEGGKMNGSIMFNGESRAFIISGKGSSDWSMERSRVSGVFCAPSGATYPLTGNSGFLAVNGNQRQSIGAEAGVRQAALSSLINSEFVIYIDFDGELVQSPAWNDGNLINAEPHPQAANLSWVTAVWQRVAEDFAPFDINVTTDRVVYENTPIANRVMCVVTPTSTVRPGAG